MSSVFGAYSKFYNLLYKDKDYAGEVNYIHELIRSHQPDSKTILDLGCGTGRHDFLLSQKGYVLTGVDRSEEMLAEANSQLAAFGSRANDLRFFQGDIRSVRLSETFDVVVSLFHVMSYQVGNKDLSAALETVRNHLKPGGIFIFDCWYGPAVLTDRPAVRIKRLEDDTCRYTRIAEPAMHPNENVVDVNYHLFIQEKMGTGCKEVKETHRMRYLFLPELELLLEKAGLEIIAAEEWMTGRPLGFDTWSSCFVARG